MLSSLKYVLPAVSLACLALGQNDTSSHAFNAQRTLSLGIVLFPGFEPLDVYGPLQIFRSVSRPNIYPPTSSSSNLTPKKLSETYKMTLSFVSFKTGPVSSRVSEHRMAPGDAPMDLSMVLSPSTVATHTFSDAPSLDVILVPGGLGNVLNDVNNDTTIQKFLKNRYAAANYILSVCTGSVELARAGLLKGKRATTNKGFWDWVTNPKHGEGIEWVPSARWTEDGKIWTSSGVAAGMDMTYAFLKMMYGTEQLDAVMNGIEYAPHQDAHWDPFSIVHKVPGANMKGNMESCVKPAGY